MTHVIRVSKEFYDLLQEYMETTGESSYVEATRNLAFLIKRCLKKSGDWKPHKLKELESIVI